MSDRWTKNIAIGVGAVGPEHNLRRSGHTGYKGCSMLQGVVLGEIAGTLICKMRRKGPLSGVDDKPSASARLLQDNGKE